ncbi:hypothetical protein HPB47_003554 [Ixodes persulcatus]|uniref:Uncharacterized protein n=1 Tax=Ixodes persulcatus TaxID=34615 RepID=A0AC60PJ75_IXOPE|nr:hypothetical protein HPB47_003554 [Ixodes persulcatus]
MTASLGVEDLSSVPQASDKKRKASADRVTIEEHARVIQKLKTAKQRVFNLEQELQVERSLSRRLQEQVLALLEKAELWHLALSSGARDVGVHLGNGVLVRADKMAYIMGARGDSMFVKEAAKLVFGRENLQMRSVTGKPCRRFKGAMAKRALTPAKVEAVRNAFHKYVDRNPKEKSPSKRIALINHYLNCHGLSTEAQLAARFQQTRC